MNTLYFLDFDGVLCDSFLECFVSSYIGYYSYYLSQEHESIPLAKYKDFRRLRPFIRRGADYLLLHKILDEKQDCNSQEDFDDILHSNGEELSDTFHKIFYQVRKYLLKNDRFYWLSLNKIYADIIQSLYIWSKNDLIYILSTKKAEFIKEILVFNKIEWPMSRIIYSGKTAKKEIIFKTLAGKRSNQAFFIDDQIDHFKGMNDSKIKIALAKWGYVQSKWLEQTEIPVFSVNNLINEINKY